MAHGSSTTGLELITVAFDPEAGEFPRAPLEAVDGEVVSAVEHFFHYGGLPHLLLVVQVRAAVERRRRSTSGAGPRATLAEPERPLFDALRAWRNGKASADGVPPYTLFTNRHIADIARRRPDTLAALAEIEGIGDAKVKRFGPKRLGFTFTTRIDNLALDVFELLVEARYSRQKEAILRRANLDLEKLRLLLRIIHDREDLDRRAFEYACAQIDTAGRMLGGWLRQQRAVQ